ncbi:hypothetical protein TrVFT333_001164 [Trichoderma virens FT-333]|nr:hypothetical protein TrVFT333_001164 [Trichoderma virens FT-333]
MAPAKRKYRNQDLQDGQAQISESNHSAQSQSQTISSKRSKLGVDGNTASANEEMEETVEELESPECSEDTFPDPLPPYDDASPLKHRTLNYRALPQNASESVHPLTPKEWKCGKPHKDGYFATYFQQPCRFTRPLINNSKNLDNLMKNKKKAEGRRLKGATILDRDVARVLEPFIRQLKFSNIKKFDQMKSVLKHIQLLHTQYDVMRRNLETTPGVLVKNNQDVVPTRSEPLLQSSKWSRVLTTIACAYRLLTLFPGRFKEYPSKGDDTIWGHSQNNWQAALCVIEHFRFRRKAKVPLEGNPPPLKAAKWFGYDTDNEVELADLYAIGKGNSVSAEIVLWRLCPSIVQCLDTNLDRMADSHDINQVLGFGHADSPSKQATSERVCERIESILQKFGPGIDIERDIRKRPNSIHFRPGAWRWRFANGEFMECLIKFLVRRTNVQYDGYLDPGIHELGRIYQLNAAVDHGTTGRARESHTQGVDDASKTIQRIFQMVAIRQEIFTAVGSLDRSESRPGNLTTAIRIRTVEMALQDDHQASM